MKKKLLAVVLCLCNMWLSGNVLAQENKSYAEVLSGIGIIDRMEKGIFSSEEELTRADYVRLISGFVGYEYDKNVESSIYYRDIERTHCMAQAADYLTTMGYISGVGNSNFAPDAPISYADAVTVLIKILGYDKEAHELGGYPFGYIAVSRNIGIKMDVDSLSLLTGGEASELIYKALNVEINNFNLYNEKFEDYELTPLFKYHGFVSAKGVVEKVVYKSVNASDEVKEANITVNGTVFAYDNADAMDWLGYGVIYYYDSENMEIVHLEKERRCRVINVDSERIEGFENGRFIYYENINDIKAETVKISSAADYYYNGKRLITTEDLNNYLPDYEGSVRLTDSDGDNEFDYISIMDYYTVVIREADLENNIYYDKYPDKKNESGQMVKMPFLELGVETGKEVYVTDSRTGISIEREDIISGCVLSVAESIDKTVVNIIVSDERISGTVSGVSTKDGKNYVTINGEKFVISKNYLDAGKMQLVVGMEADFKLTAGRMIADVTAKSDYAYLINAYKDEEADTETVIFRLFMADGSIQKLRSAKKITLNEFEKVTPYTVYDQLKNGDEIQSTLVLYDVNSDNQIKELYTTSAGGTSRKKLYRYYVSGDPVLNQNTKNIGGKATFTTDCLLFTVPANPKTAKDSEFDVFSISEYAHFTRLADFYYYKQDQETIAANVVLKQGTATVNIKDTEPMMLVDTVSECVNDDGEIVWTVSGYREGKYVSYEAEEESYLDAVSYGDSSSNPKRVRISDGDMVRFSFNNIGKIAGTQIFFDADLTDYKPPYNPSAPSDFNKACRTTYGYVYQRDGDFIRIVTDDLSDPQTVVSETAGEIQSLDPTTCIYEVNLSKNRGKIEKIQPYNIKDYKNYASSCDKVFIYQREYIRDIIIYR